jgi:hypothetical protein
LATAVRDSDTAEVVPTTVAPTVILRTALAVADRLQLQLPFALVRFQPQLRSQPLPMVFVEYKVVKRVQAPFGDRAVHNGGTAEQDQTTVERTVTRTLVLVLSRFQLSRYSSINT